MKNEIINCCGVSFRDTAPNRSKHRKKGFIDCQLSKMKNGRRSNSVTDQERRNFK